MARDKQFDAFQQILPRDDQTSRVLIFDIDDESLAEFGQWPWPRPLLASLIEHAANGGALAVGLNVVFPEPDRTSPDQLASLATTLDPELQAALRALPNNDNILATALRKTRSVLAEVASLKTTERKLSRPKLSLVTIGGNPKRFIFRLPDIAENIPVLAQSADGIGNATLAADADGVVRRIPLLFQSKDSIRPSLAIEMLRVASDERTLGVKSDGNGIAGLIIARNFFATDRFGRIWLRYAHQRADRYVSAGDVLSGTLRPEYIKGKFVLIGTTAAGLLDAKGTSVDDSMPSIEIQAQILDSVLSRDVLSRPRFVTIVEIASVIVLAVLMAIGIPGLKAVWGFTAGLPVIGALFVGAWHLYSSSGVMLDLTFPAFSGFVLYAVSVTLQYAKEGAQKRVIRRAFVQYISPELVERLADDAKSLHLGGEIKPMSILFSDIRGFTSLSEELSHAPEQITQILNSYFTTMTDRILEFSGAIDKYIGDGIMAFWNAPLNDPHHARHACEAALEMLDGLRKLNRKLALEAEKNGVSTRVIDIGIGVNTGPCLVGNLGSEHRFTYSAVGDAVNLASRLESLTKIYGVKIVVGEATESLLDGFATLEIDIVRVRGKHASTRIFTLLGPPKLRETAGFSHFSETHNRFLTAYRTRDWALSRRLLADCRGADVWGLQALYDLYEVRLYSLEQSPPPADWDGATSL